jgi:hypothetical protein
VGRVHWDTTIDAYETWKQDTGWKDLYQQWLCVVDFYHFWVAFMGTASASQCAFSELN